MRSSLFSLAFLTGWASSQSMGKFFNPPNMPSGTVNYAQNNVLHAGDTISVEWSTTFSEYTIALWQQELDVEGANIGPIVFETRSPAKPEFLWTVQLFSFDITKSAVFFLWLHPGDSSFQGDKRNASFATRYFNISGDPKPSSTTILPTSSITKTASSISTAPSTGTSTGSAQSSTTASPAANPFSTSPAPSAASDQPHLSTGALAGIAISGGLAAILAVVCAILWYRRGKDRRSTRESDLRVDLNDRDTLRAPNYRNEKDQWQSGYSSSHRHEPDRQYWPAHQNYHQQRPSEMSGSSGGRHEPVELA